LELDPQKEKVGCFWCSWNRRKLLFETAQKHRCNKIVMGHNLDDITETIMMNMAYFGEISAMNPYLDLFGGKLTMIRPLCYLEKKEIIRFFNQFDFPDLHYECPIGDTSRRQTVRETIESLQKKCPYVKKNIFKSLKKIKKDYLL
jgi:tRNA 2-thiocytidine biosynthesis protein TtcA